MQPFLAKESPSQVTTYDLLSVICHHGTAGSTRWLRFPAISCYFASPSSPSPSPLSTSGGHYIAYCQNVINGQWYEFDDQYVTEVHETVVQNAEAYVLFYRCKKKKKKILVLSRVRLCSHFTVFFSPRAQKKQRGVSEGEAEGGGSGQHEGAQPAAVLHLQGMAQQVQHLRRTGANQQPHISVSARRCVPPCWICEVTFLPFLTLE